MRGKYTKNLCIEFNGVIFEYYFTLMKIGIIKEFKTPPLMIVGSSFAFEKIPAIKDVVVVLPCEPATTIFLVKETM